VAGVGTVSVRTRVAPRRRQSGFTLLELLIAAALLAVLAVLSWRGLDSVLVARERIVASSDELRALTVAFAQMDEDLRRSWPVRLLRLPDPSIAFTVSGERAQARLELLREASTAGEPTRVQRVAYRLRAGVLERGFGTWTSPSMFAAAARADDAAAFVWQPVLAGVVAFEMDGWIAGRGWLPANALAGQLTGSGSAAQAGNQTGGGQPGGGQPGSGQPGNQPGNQPATGAQPSATQAVTGVQVVIRRADGGEIVRIFSVRD
jgi:general secretion pathway protein J